MPTMADNGVHHLKTDHEKNLTDILKPFTFAGMSIQGAIEFGCVYVNGIRQQQDCLIEMGQTIRVHTRPKRYPLPSQSAKETIVFDHQDFLVFDKPAGLPVHATLDNAIENAKTWLEAQLSIPLYSTHRLDIPTRGLLILAKTPAAQSEINKAFSKRRVNKIYRAVTRKPVPVGPLIHFIEPTQQTPRPIRTDESPGWWRCELEIISSEERAGVFHNTIRLITGRTHQIRAQFSALGCPIFGDKLYGDERANVNERLELECYQLSFPYRSQTMIVTRPARDL